MKRLIVGSCAAAFCAWSAMAPTPNATAETRTLPMQFELRLEGPAEACGQTCRTWVSATGAITSDTPREFQAFSKKNDLRDATFAIDSDGGSVLGALALGRAVRALNMTTTVGKTVEAGTDDAGRKRARLLPRAYCESMCAFVLLAGVERVVPATARVMVHQIWLGDRRDDPTAAKYSAEDLVLVQRDIGRLAQYTVEMGGSIELLEMALRIPPWEPMRLLSREELRGMKIVTSDDGKDAAPNAVAMSSPVVLASGPRAPVSINDRTWVMTQRSGRAVLARQHPLTVEGDDIGSFELFLTCGPGQDYSVTYIEQRRATSGGEPEKLTEVELSLAGKQIPLKVVSSRTNATPRALDTVANGSVPAELVRTFAESRSRSLTVETTSGDVITAIRIGNAGLARGFSRLNCGAGQPIARRTDLRREAEAQPR